MTMTFIPESVRFASESPSVVFAVIIAVVAAIVMTGFWELLFQEIKLKRHEQKCRRIRRAVERLQKLDSNRIGNTPIVDRVTQGPVSDLPRIRSARSSAKGNVQGSKDLPVLFHGKGSKEELRQQKGQRRGGETMRLLSIGLLCLFLAGCAAAAQDDAKCRSYGSSPGESAYVQCRATLDSARTLAESMAR